jgi:hypothetical protein
MDSIWPASVNLFALPMAAVLTDIEGRGEHYVEAQARFARLPAASEAGSVAELIEELERRYVKRLPPQHDDAWMIDQEIRFLMSCAL